MPSEARGTKTSYLVSHAGGKRLALPLADVIEVMRPLPVSRLEGAPEFVLGAAVVRGAPVPVIDAGALVGAAPGGRTPSRLVSLRVGTRRAALAVDELIGIHALDASELEAVPPLLRGVAAGAADAVAALDEELVLVLASARLVPADVWRVLEGGDRP
ncbi:MAG TPA: chemotaxis protein CheW [Anaeromyxobacter sp.]